MKPLAHAVGVACFVAMLGVAIPVTAQEVFISHVDGTYAPGKVSPGETLIFHIGLKNTAATNVIGFSFGFEFSGQGGAKWDTIVAYEEPDFDYYQYFNFIHNYDAYVTPPAPDTTQVVFSTFTTPGLPPGDSILFYVIEVGPIDGPLGSTITIDSVSSFGPAPVEWELHYTDAVIGVADFQGTTIVIDECCVGTLGNVNADPENVINITDLTMMVNNLFVTFGEFPCPKAANISLDPQGLINLTDLTLLLNNLFVTFEPLPTCP
jgi:hypothetical protein